ncbi:MAG: hypothetical protein IKM75_01785 [Bacteroidales bacterium]|jgi:hypothetical protein|nr:hypothetical protein [Bacteroidales bacterium]MBR6863569.1 hypothetical protein [Bacteroidales bacterium]
MEHTRNIAPMKLELLLAVVQNDKVAYFSSLIQSHQANLQLTVPAKGTTHLILNYLGLTDRPKSLVVSVIRASESKKLIELLDETFKKGKGYKGIAFTIPMTSVVGTLVYGFLSNDKRTVKKEEA